jgi:uncharacterized protein YeaO (DUF488 family)
MRTTAKHDIRLRRAYAAPAESDGRRVLVDGVWPRGVSRDELRLDEWMKEVAPSAALRRWFGHDPAKWETFKDRYFRELDQRSEAVERLLAKCRAGTVTLVFGAKETLTTTPSRSRSTSSGASGDRENQR